jgi:hypothetical protein
VLAHSEASGRLFHGLDLGYLIELAAKSEVQLATHTTVSVALAVIFFLFMLFATGGIIESYARERELVPGEFFQAAGAFFWRLVRLLLWLIVFLVPIAILAGLVNSYSGRLASDSSYEKLGFGVEVAGFVVLWLVSIVIRLCFDMAQVEAVLEDQRGMTRVLGASIRRTLANFGTLFWLYFWPSLLGWAGAAVAIFLWVKFIHSEYTVPSFLLGQFVAWLWIATRLWQRASEVVWYRRQRPAEIPVLVTADNIDAVKEEGLAEVARYTPPEPPAS